VRAAGVSQTKLDWITAILSNVGWLLFAILHKVAILNKKKQAKRNHPGRQFQGLDDS